MVIYSVTWTVDPELVKGKGRLTDGTYVCFTVLCRSVGDAVACLGHYFHSEYKGKFDLDDGSVKTTRSKVDSRNFNPTYLYMDGIKSPLYLGNLQDSLTKYCMKHFRF